MDQHQPGMVHCTDVICSMICIVVYCTGVQSSPQHEDHEAVALICTDNLCDFVDLVVWGCSDPLKHGFEVREQLLNVLPLIC